jgi:hypothetical protein
MWRRVVSLLWDGVLKKHNNWFAQLLSFCDRILTGTIQAPVPCPWGPPVRCRTLLHQPLNMTVSHCFRQCITQSSLVQALNLGLPVPCEPLVPNNSPPHSPVRPPMVTCRNGEYWSQVAGSNLLVHATMPCRECNTCACLLPLCMPVFSMDIIGFSLHHILQATPAK